MYSYDLFINEVSFLHSSSKFAFKNCGLSKLFRWLDDQHIILWRDACYATRLHIPTRWREVTLGWSMTVFPSQPSWLHEFWSDDFFLLRKNFEQMNSGKLHDFKNFSWRIFFFSNARISNEQAVASRLYKFAIRELHARWFFCGISWRWREALKRKENTNDFFLVHARRGRENLELCIRILIYQLGLIWGLIDTLITYRDIYFIIVYLSELLNFMKLYLNIKFLV